MSVSTSASLIAIPTIVEARARGLIQSAAGVTRVFFRCSAALRPRDRALRLGFRRRLSPRKRILSPSLLDHAEDPTASDHGGLTTPVSNRAIVFCATPVTEAKFFLASCRASSARAALLYLVARLLSIGGIP